jgi:acetylornithine/succinyldiaminopimelate/putrescine aminotransferase
VKAASQWGGILRRSSINLPPKSHTSTFGGNPLALLAGANVIRFLPPLVITNDEIDRVVTALKTVLDS